MLRAACCAVNNSRNFETIANLRDFREIRSCVSITQPHAALRSLTQHHAAGECPLQSPYCYPCSRSYCYPCISCLFSPLQPPPFFIELTAAQNFSDSSCHLCASVSRVFGVYVLYMSGLKPPLLSLLSLLTCKKNLISCFLSSYLFIYFFFQRSIAFS